MSTKLKGCCKSCNCTKLDELGPLDLIKDTWKSSCGDRILKIECSEDCDCVKNGLNCKNRMISLCQRKKLGVDLIEIDSWGLDAHTCYNIVKCLPGNITGAIPQSFIETTLMKAINLQGIHGWDISCALKDIIRKKIEYNKKSIDQRELDRKLAMHLYAYAKNAKDKEKMFKIYSKGRGIICNLKEGIPSNVIIIEYLGEIYSPWKWYEKQDAIKQTQKDMSTKITNVLPDFYNIMLERHKEDPEGYHIVFIDPIHMGAYCSRFSHSCDPNCSTVTMVANGKYSIGMYSVKPIEYEEELTFDYNSVTESESEYKAAVCLCGSSKCRGYYLSYVNSEPYNCIINKYHNFLDRMGILYLSVLSPQLTPEDIELLNKYGIKSMLIGRSPEWLKKWAAYILKFIELEKSRLIEESKEIKTQFNPPPDAAIIKGVADNRLQNLAITLDKVQHILDIEKIKDPPIIIMSNQQIFNYLWEDTNSIRATLLGIFTNIPNSNLFEKQIHLLNTTLKVENELYDDVLNKAKQIIIEVSALTYSINSNLVLTQPLSDILYMIGSTKYFFTNNSAYKAYKSDHILVRQCDINNSAEDAMKRSVGYQSTVVHKERKKYEKSFVWGQLNGWYKQTVNMPSSSLSSERRGVLIYPCITSFILSGQQSMNKSNSEFICSKEEEIDKLKAVKQYPFSVI